ncbi:hypothetical protein I302_108067 [Kwoniella bestiolae CBS 10118]|uniref:Uncharacterized protein n=1 Tax=Kwoniella bestiolae CBS 10118 TaxID=1296100 RepID=A0A1B9FWR8_9TREE|nr:hypothetical protein I302_07567 [Kwoniella bestiolae CBS 10118]OCF23213.1 hypothetical protein I302_07567 [Kwoniella bestiolae CBS 10118]
MAARVIMGDTDRRPGSPHPQEGSFNGTSSLNYDVPLTQVPTATQISYIQPRGPTSGITFRFDKLEPLLTRAARPDASPFLQRIIGKDIKLFHVEPNGTYHYSVDVPDEYYPGGPPERPQWRFTSDSNLGNRLWYANNSGIDPPIQIDTCLSNIPRSNSSEPAWLLSVMPDAASRSRAVDVALHFSLHNVPNDHGQEVPTLICDDIQPSANTSPEAEDFIEVRRSFVDSSMTFTQHLHDDDQFLVTTQNRRTTSRHQPHYYWTGRAMLTQLTENHPSQFGVAHGSIGLFVDNYSEDNGI